MSISERLAPELRHLATARVDLSAQNLRAARSSLDQRRRDSAAAVDHTGVEVTDTVADGVQVRLYRAIPASTDAPPAVVFCHSGAFVLGNLDTDHRWCVDIARSVGAVVVSVDYRLAPETPFPAGLDDAAAVLRWVGDNAARLAVDPRRIAVAGNSAGGALAALLAQASVAGEVPPVVFQLLHQPVLDDRMTPSKAEFVDTPGFDGAAVELMWRHYLAGERAPAGAVPGRADDLTGVAGALITCAELDPLRDEEVDYALRLLWAGVAVELHIIAGVCHGFDSLLPQCQLSRDLFSLHTKALRRAFGT